MARRREWLADLVRKRGITHKRLAKEVDVHPKTPGRWIRGTQGIYDHNRQPLADALGISLDELLRREAKYQDSVETDPHRGSAPDMPMIPLNGGNSPGTLDEPSGDTEELRERLLNAAVVDSRAIALLGTQADHIREVDRMLGARAAEAQMHGHLAALDLLRTFAIAPQQREPLARLYADAATLAGWQCLDLGELNKSWKYYETAKNAAREEDPTAALAHALAEQAYVLVELGQLPDALQLVEYSCSVASTAVPPLLLSWLSAVQGEVHAALGNDADCRRAFEAADHLLPDDPNDPELPYLVLNRVHLSRWRGNALARLGDATAIEDLRNALHGLDSSFMRARAGLHVDLAQALAASKRHTEAREELREAQILATQVGSARQRRRIRQLESMYAT